MSTTEASTQNLFLTRGIIALAWAAVFSAASDSLTVGAGVLLVLYPLIDVLASLLARRRRRPATPTPKRELTTRTCAGPPGRGRHPNQRRSR